LKTIRTKKGLFLAILVGWLASTLVRCKRIRSLKSHQILKKVHPKPRFSLTFGFSKSCMGFQNAKFYVTWGVFQKKGKSNVVERVFCKKGKSSVVERVKKKGGQKLCGKKELHHFF